MITIQKTLSVVTTGAYKMYHTWRWRTTRKHRKLLDLVYANSKTLAGENLTCVSEYEGSDDALALSPIRAFVAPRCYAYALDVDSPVSPGYRIPGHSINFETRESKDRRRRLVNRLVVDGLQPASCEDIENSLLWIFNRAILCYSAPYEEDYHFVRIDADGTFSHKEGQYRPTELRVKSGSDLLTVTNRDGTEYRFVGVFITQ